MKTRTLCFICIVLLTSLLTSLLDAGDGFFYDGNFLVKNMREYEKAVNEGGGPV